MADAREALRRLLPKSINEVRNAISGASHVRIMEAVFESIREHVRRAAMEILGETTPEREAQLYWDCIDHDTQNKLLQFFRQKQFEDVNYQRCSEKLKKVGRAFFDLAHEANGVRPLGMALGYIPSCAQNYSAMTMEEALVEHQHSGLPEDDSLLQPCRQNPALTKYQGLFQTGEEYDDLRLWFFQNHRYNVHQERGLPMKNLIKLIAENCKEQGARTTHECLQDCLRAVEGRYDCFGDEELPPFFSPQRSWEHYREAVAQDAYWLSCEEAALVALLAGRSVDIYEFNMKERSFELVVSARSPTVDTEVVSTALQPGEEDPRRGHFSRIWPEARWREHAAMVTAAAAARASAQQELIEERLRDHDVRDGISGAALGDQVEGQEGCSISRASSCTSFSTSEACGA